MSEPVIKVDNLSKRYVIGHQHSRNDGLRHAIEQAVRAPVQWLRSRHEQNKQLREEFWALKDVSFEVRQGDVVGIVGRNGAGKSTLLKILSRITEPTKGRIEIDGRVASLLEVGTGFHQELTGSENIFLNGAILGMTRLEIKRKFDEIVAFSGIEKFLDTPVKRYSSGMYVRLAFAIAAHLEPEILIVDEVLAVGDADFQRKCLGKMKDVASGGRTVLFVSHNMPVVQKLCNRAIFLSQGRILIDDNTTVVLEEYQRAAEGHSLLLGRTINLDQARRWGGSGKARFHSVRMHDPEDPEGEELPVRQGDVAFTFVLRGDCSSVKAAAIQISDLYDRKIVNCNTLELGRDLSLNEGEDIRMIIRDLKLRPGNYKVGLWIGDSEEGHIDVIADELSLEILPPVGRQWVSRHDGIYECRFECEIVTARHQVTVLT
jgi:ABC-type polysaccharide/polyol phosphate transport system ATPase subunit